jgi:preprotein translocase subunit SecA
LKRRYLRCYRRIRKEAYDISEKTLLEIPEAFAVVKETARRFKDNTDYSYCTPLDRELSAKSYITLDGDKAIWANSCCRKRNYVGHDSL